MIKNRFIKIPLLATLLLLLSVGCSKSFLEVDPQGQLTEVQALADPEAANKLVGGAYNTLYLGGFGDNTVGFLWVMATDVASDDGDKGSTPSDFGDAGQIDNFTHTPSNFIFNNIWNGHYTAIGRVNRAIDVLNQSTFDAGTKARLLGELRFLRGFYYFNLVRFFGGVPKVIRVPDPSEGNNDEFQTRASAAEIYSVIIDDLQFAVDNLPMKGEATTQVGRANKGAAQSYLAKVYLYQKNWQKAFELSQAVINSGKYSLVPDYKAVLEKSR